MNAKWTAYLFASVFAGVSGSALAQASVDFQTLDANDDGYITKDDVSSGSRLHRDWDSYDANSDDRLDEAEFSQFETMDRGRGMSDGVPNNPPGTEGYDSYGGPSGSDAPSLYEEPGERD